MNYESSYLIDSSIESLWSKEIPELHKPSSRNYLQLVILKCFLNSLSLIFYIYIYVHNNKIFDHIYITARIIFSFNQLRLKLTLIFQFIFSKIIFEL